MNRRRWLNMFVLPILLLMAAVGLWLHKERQQYARNRQLIASLVHLNITQAIALVNEGADPNTPFKSPPLPSFKRLVDQFLHHKSLSTNSSPTAFLFACGTGCGMAASDGCGPPKHPDILPLVQCMFAHGVNLNAQTADKETALQEAVFTNQMRVVQWLLEHGANVNAQDAYGWTPLHRAMLYAHLDILTLLLAHGADVNAQEESGKTILHFALNESAEASLIQQLLTYGADPNKPDKQGQTPIMMAHWAHRPDIVALLQKNGK